MHHTTCGWKILVLWKDRSGQWIPLKDLKESHPVEIAVFAKTRGITDEPAFVWWVPYTQHNVIITTVTSHVRKTSHKYGIEVPTSIAHAYQIDVKNGDNFWGKAIKKEMHNVCIAFGILEPSANVPVGWTPVTGQIIFNINTNLTPKARWCLMATKPLTLTAPLMLE